MRIIGGHDYYDGVLAHGRDEALVFVRKDIRDAPVMPSDSCPLETERPWMGFRRKFGRTRNDNEVERDGLRHLFRPLAVWFAGRRYGGVEVTTRTARWEPGREDEIRHFWDAAGFGRFMEEAGLELSRMKNLISADRYIHAATIGRHFGREASRGETEWLIANGVSIAVWHACGDDMPGTSRWRRESGWKIDVDGLGKMGFAKRLDPFAAFQELSMWKGGVLPRDGNPTVEITDEKTLVRKHGMDEWSFRRPPGQR